MIRVGVDAGGTFTDIVAVGDAWRRELKLPSRPDDPAAVVAEALSALLPSGVSPELIELTFSTTAATNALLMRSGGPTLLFTTAGFEDVLEIGRQARPVLYALEPRRPPPLVPAEDRRGVDERIGAGGEILRRLTDEEIARLVAAVKARPAATIAICFLHAHAQPMHERALAEAMRADGRQVSVSSEVCPLPREFERSSTTVIDAYVAPVLGATLQRLGSERLRLHVMESSGGARLGQSVRPARTVLSGPAAGVVAAERLARRLGLGAAIALDIGGTSTDVALIRDGVVARVDELSIDGLPIALPSVAVHSVGAGGGSIAWLDGGGALKLGPRSAGAVPGPAAYGRGGKEPTVTDAHAVLGRLGETLCGGTITLDHAAARTAIEQLATPLGISVEDTAHAVTAVADATIARAVRAASLGLSPSGLTLIAYGGASGLHAVAVARALGIACVVVPVSPGLLCAQGALAADVVIEALWSTSARVEAALPSAARARLDELAAEVAAALVEEGVPAPRRHVERIARLRYEGQGIDGELELPADGDLRADFEAAHERVYGHRLQRPVELVRIEARGRGIRGEGEVAFRPAIGWPRRGVRHVDGRAVPRYLRERLRPGAVVVGPALVDELSATLYLPEGARATVERDGILTVEVST